MHDESHAAARERVDQVVRDPLLRRFAHGALHVRRHQRLYAITGVWVLALLFFPVFRGGDGAASSDVPPPEAAAPPEAQTQAVGDGAAPTAFEGSGTGDGAAAAPTVRHSAPSPTLDSSTSAPAPPPAPRPADEGAPEEGPPAVDDEPEPEPHASPAPAPAPPPPSSDDGGDDTEECTPADEEGSGDPIAGVLGALGDDEETDEACES